MAKFKASEAVEALDYDFEDFGNGAKGVVPEPSTALVNGYMQNMKELIREGQNLMRQAKGLAALEESADEMSDEDLAKNLETMDEASAQINGFQDRAIEYLAVLCGAEWIEDEPDSEGKSSPENGHYEGGSPSLEDLQTLPYRHLQAFTTWLMGEIRPKKVQPAGKR